MIETQSFSISYTADGSQTEWAFPYPYLSGNDIKLYIIINGTKTLIDPTYYSFDTTTNKITYPLSGDPVAVGTQVYLERKTPLTQEENASLGNFKSDDIERIADKLTMISQEVTKASGELYIDDALSAHSENAVQNKVITAQLSSINANKQDKLPSGTTGTYLQKTADGVQWSAVDALPSQSGHDGKFLTTNGTNASWKAVPTRNIGEIVTSTVPLTDAGLHLLDGSLISAGSYLAFVDYISSLVSTYPDLFTTEAAWQTAVTTYGVCGKFVYDGANSTVRLPKITGFIEGTTDPTALGDLVQAGLPNITGEFIPWAGKGTYDIGVSFGGSTGAVRNVIGVTTKILSEQSYTGTGSSYATFDASRSSSIYGNSSTVQPQAIKTLYYIVIAAAVKTDIQVDIDEIATDLNGKADVDLTNVNNSGSSLSASWAMPSSTYTILTTGASGSTYTAPSNGYLVARGTASASGQYLELVAENVDSLIHSSAAVLDIAVFIPILKGKIATLYYSTATPTVTFVYAEGSKSEAN